MQAKYSVFSFTSKHTYQDDDAPEVALVAFRVVVVAYVVAMERELLQEHYYY